VVVGSLHHRLGYCCPPTRHTALCSKISL
jgi:hypothetical protein